MNWTALGDVRLFVFLLLGFGFAVCDLWLFHSVDKQTDLLIMLGALGGAGVSVAHAAGVNTALSVPPTASTVPPPPRSTPPAM